MPYRISWGRCHVCGLHRDVVDIPNRPDAWNYSPPVPVCQDCLEKALKAFPLRPPSKEINSTS